MLEIGECGFDGGDCDDAMRQFMQRNPNCATVRTDPFLFGFFYRYHEILPKCSFDDGSCVDYNSKYPNLTDGMPA